MPEKPESVDGSQSGSEEESEYEIEQVLDAKRGQFPDGRMGYFVKWKGYPESENSWVDERDAVNAVDLVKEYWDKHPQKKKSAVRKSVDKKSPRKPRKSVVEDDSEVESVAPKKRGRKSSVKKADDEMDVDEPRPSKRTRKRSASASASGAKPDSEVEEKKIGTMKEYMHLHNWEGLVRTVDTVEREGDVLIVYFTLTTDEAVREESQVCKDRFPQKLLDFYESNLKWKAVDEKD